jgi:hypothetical protein
MSEHPKDRFLVKDLLDKPQAAAALVGRKVIVELKSSTSSMSGYFHSMDPANGHLIIVTLENIDSDQPLLKSTHLFMSSHVKSVLVIDAENRQHDCIQKLLKDASSDKMNLVRDVDTTTVMKFNADLQHTSPAH